jgi:hypothetical protein
MEMENTMKGRVDDKEVQIRQIAKYCDSCRELDVLPTAVVKT